MHWRDEAPKISGFGKQWGYVQGTQGLPGIPFEALMHGFPHPVTQCKGSILRGKWIILNEIHLLILKYLLEGQGSVGTSYGDRGTGKHHFCPLPVPC